MTTIQAPSTPLRDLSCKIIAHTQRGDDLWELVLKPARDCFGNPINQLGSQPGQFVMVALPQAEGFSFRRPMSVYWENPNTGEFAIFYQVHGRGTRRMAQWQVGDSVNILGPLGNVWPRVATSNEVLLIGGGIGIAPLIHWQQRTADGEKANLVYGVANSQSVGLTDTSNLHLCTDDGSAGFHGNVVAGLHANPAWFAHKTTAFICGPMGMMRACVEFLQTHAPEMTVYVSLEEHMPCGTGACTGCVVPLMGEAVPVKSCQRGPIFNAAQLDWSRLGARVSFEKTACEVASHG